MGAGYGVDAECPGQPAQQAQAVPQPQAPPIVQPAQQAQASPQAQPPPDGHAMPHATDAQAAAVCGESVTVSPAPTVRAPAATTRTSPITIHRVFTVHLLHKGEPEPATGYNKETEGVS